MPWLVPTCRKRRLMGVGLLETSGLTSDASVEHKGREDLGFDRGMSCRDFSSVAKWDF